MRTLVTGGAGFIGSHLVDALIEAGHDVRVLDNLSVGKLDNVSHHLASSQFRFVEGSILDEGLLQSLIAEVDVIYHLAAVVGVKYVVENPLLGIRTNVRGTENVLALAAKYDVRTVIASSSEVYGKSTDVPLREDGDRVLGNTRVNRWSYSDSKAIDECVALAYARQGLPCCALRYFNAYGPRLDPRGYGSVVARFFTQALNDDPITVYDDGSQTRCFTFVGDTVRGTMRAGEVDEAAGLVFNIGAEAETSVNEIAETIRDLCQSKSRIVHIPSSSAYGTDFEETHRRVPDTALAREVLGFQATTSLEQGLRTTLAWFTAQGNVRTHLSG